MQKDTNKVVYIIKHYNQGRFGLCEAIRKIFGENGERVYLVEENWETLRKPLLNMLRRLDADSISQCGDLLFKSLAEIDFSSFVEIISTMVKISGVEASRETVKELFSREIIDVDELLEYINRLESEKNWSTMIKILLVFEPIIPVELYNEYLNKIAQQQNVKASKWLFLANIDKIHGKRLLTEFKGLYEEIKSFLSQENFGQIFESLAKIYVVYLKADLETKGYIESTIRELFQGKKIRFILKEIKIADIDKFYADAALWFISLFPQRFDVNEVLPIIMELIESGILVNMDHVSELFSKLTIKSENLPNELLSLKTSRSWRKRLLATYILGGLLQHGNDKVLSFFTQLCRDKRSEIRKKCARSLLDFLERSTKIEKSVINAILASSWTEGISKMLHMLLRKEVPKEIANLVVAGASKIPRSSIMEVLVEFVSKNYSKIENNTLLRSTIRILLFSSRKKILLSKVVDLITTLLAREDFREEFLKELSGTKIPNETKRVILNKIRELDLQF